jgi:hypothetical protein
MRAVAALIALALAGCTQHSIRPPDLGPLAASCSQECKTTCLPETWPQWTGDPNAPETWDALAEQVISNMKTIARTCDTARASCVKCMQGLEDVGVVCGITRECR